MPPFIQKLLALKPLSRLLRVSRFVIQKDVTQKTVKILNKRTGVARGFDGGVESFTGTAGNDHGYSGRDCYAAVHTKAPGP